jgi:hypothetical protein
MSALVDSFRCYGDDTDNKGLCLLHGNTVVMQHVDLVNQVWRTNDHKLSASGNLTGWFIKSGYTIVHQHSLKMASALTPA